MHRKRGVTWFVPLLMACLGFLAFLRMPGSENVRAVQVVILLATGMCIGVALVHLLTPRARELQ